jgi:peptide-N4-(N-acetyl-beta-glucosaminyl)asparagine amidase
MLADSQLKRDILALVPDFSAEIQNLLDNPPFEPFGKEDARALVLARWYKASFMKWVDPILCDTCSSECVSMGQADPNEEERSIGAGRVELHQCTKQECKRVVRFPRINRPSTLLKTRTGRCGE